MTSVAYIGWGRYRNFEGPFYKGHCRFELAPDASEDYKRLAVITATEGGRYDAINMYDRCILSVGLIQFCEAAMFSVCGLLGAVATKRPDALDEVRKVCASTGYEFKQIPSGKWRFHKTCGEVIDTLQEQQQLFLLHSNGIQGSWDEDSKEHAKRWAAAVSSVFEIPGAQDVQVSYAVERLLSFVMPEANNFMFGWVPNGADPKWVSAAQAAFLSFAANLPVIAAKHLKIFVESTRLKRFSPEWVTGLLRELTFGPEIVIYPARYNAIRPVLEKLYGIDLPDFSEELKAWREKENIDVNVPCTVSIDSTFGLQHALVALGYDLGPRSCDGVYGPKTQGAVMEFQSRNNLKVDGIFGPRTRAVMIARLSER